MYFNYSNFVAGSVEAQKAFFKYCEEYLKKVIPFYSGPISPYQYLRYYRFNEEAEPRNSYADIDHQFVEPLNDLYFEGRTVYQVIDCSFTEFKEALLFGNQLNSSSNYYPFYSRKNKEPSKYQKQPHHNKKVYSETDVRKQEWREKKGFTKDHRRKNRSFYGQCKKIRKFFDNKQHRQWEKQCLHHEKYDELTDFKNKAIFDPWKID